MFHSFPRFRRTLWIPLFAVGLLAVVVAVSVARLRSGHPSVERRAPPSTGLSGAPGRTPNPLGVPTEALCPPDQQALPSQSHNIASQSAPGASRRRVGPPGESDVAAQSSEPIRQVGSFSDDFDSSLLDEKKWSVTRKNDFAEFAVDVVKAKNDERNGRLRLRCGTIGTDDAMVKFLGVASKAPLDLSGGKRLALDFDWNDQSNGCYLTGAIYLCPTLTHGSPADEEDWLCVKYVGVPPGKKGRAAICLKNGGTARLLYDDGWPNEQRAGRDIGRQHVEILLDSSKWNVSENGRLLFESDDKSRCPFRKAHLYLQMSSHSNYPPREIFFDNVAFGPIQSPPPADLGAEEPDPDEEGALERLRAAVEQCTDALAGFEARWKLAEAYCEAGRYEDAERLCEGMASGDAPAWQREKVLQRIWDVHRKSGKLGEKIAALEKAAEANPTDEGPLQSLYYIHTRVTRNPTRAAEALQRLAALKPDNVGLLRQLAAASARAHNLDVALGAYKRLRECDPRYRAYYCERASSLCRDEGDHDLAVEWADSIIEADRESCSLRVRAAKQFERLELYDRAKEEYQKAAELVPEGPVRERYSLELASLYLKTGDTDRAIQICESIAAESKSRANRDYAGSLLEQMRGESEKDE